MPGLKGGERLIRQVIDGCNAVRIVQQLLLTQLIRQCLDMSRHLILLVDLEPLGLFGGVSHTGHGQGHRLSQAFRHRVASVARSNVLSLRSARFYHQLTWPKA